MLSGSAKFYIYRMASAFYLFFLEFENNFWFIG
jgi:hypothetical protein